MTITLRHYFHLLTTYLRPQLPRVLLLAVLMLLTIGSDLLYPQIVRHFIDAASVGSGLDVLIQTALLFIGVTLAGRALAIGARYVSENVGLLATNALRGDLILHSLQLDPSFHNAHTRGDMIERIEGDVAALANFFSQFVIQILGNGLLLVGILVVLFLEDWRIGLSLGSFSVIALLALRRLQTVAMPHWSAERQSSSDFFGFLEEALANAEIVRSNGAVAYVLDRFYRLSRQLYLKTRKALLMAFVVVNTTTGLFTLGNALALLLGGYLFSRGVLSIGTVYLIFQYTELLHRPLTQITDQIQDLQKAGASIHRIEDLRQTRSSIRDGRGDALPECAPQITLQHVSFCYTPDVPVLHDVTFTIPPKTVLGLLGRTGSGKTTISRLLFRLYDPESGAICFDGVDLRDARVSAVRQRVALVTQDVQLFRGTIRDNLTLFDDTISDEQVITAINDLGLDRWFAGLAAGLDTELESASALSAGEAQLLAFARAFLRNPTVVILDEASSRLDPLTERLIEGAIERLLHNRTAIVIAHRLSTIRSVGAIVLLEDGRVVEHGERQQLAQDPTSRFSQLLQTGFQEVLA